MGGETGLPSSPPPSHSLVGPQHPPRGSLQASPHPIFLPPGGPPLHPSRRGWGPSRLGRASLQFPLQKAPHEEEEDDVWADSPGGAAHGGPCRASSLPPLGDTPRVDVPRGVPSCRRGRREIPVHFDDSTWCSQRTLKVPDRPFPSPCTATTRKMDGSPSSAWGTLERRPPMKSSAWQARCSATSSIEVHPRDHKWRRTIAATPPDRARPCAHC